MPASLLANWKAELRKFAPTLSFLIAHPSENPASNSQLKENDAEALDLYITTYGMLSRTEWLRETRLGPRHSRRGPGDQELGHAAIADRQGAEGDGPCRHDGNPGRESLVRPLVALRFSEPRPTWLGQDDSPDWSSKWRPVRRINRFARSSDRTSSAGSRPTSESSPTCPKRSRCRPSAR